MATIGITNGYQMVTIFAIMVSEMDLRDLMYAIIVLMDYYNSV